MRSRNQRRRKLSGRRSADQHDARLSVVPEERDLALGFGTDPLVVLDTRYSSNDDDWLIAKQVGIFNQLLSRTNLHGTPGLGLSLDQPSFVIKDLSGIRVDLGLGRPDLAVLNLIDDARLALGYDGINESRCGNRTGNCGSDEKRGENIGTQAVALDPCPKATEEFHWQLSEQYWGSLDDV